MGGAVQYHPIFVASTLPAFTRFLTRSLATEVKYARGDRCRDGERRSCHAVLPPLLSVAPMMDYTDNHFRQLARLLTRHTWLWTEMVVDNTLVHQRDSLDRFLEFLVVQNPLVLQLGGSDPATLALATKLADGYGYQEINLNCGCPSDKVAGHGCFGARLMLNPALVAKATAAMAECSRAPISVKCRIGVDDFDSYGELCDFVGTVAERGPVTHFIVHARKALLSGLSPAQNRSVPPLRYEYVLALLRDFPGLRFTLNGGITTLPQAVAALRSGAHGVMIGRAAYSSPWTVLGSADETIYGTANPATSRRKVLADYAAYADSTLGRYRPNNPNLRTLVKPLLGLFHGEPGGGVWRREIDTALRDAKTMYELLERTLPVVPDVMLDAPPTSPLSMSTSQPTLEVGRLPESNQWTRRENPVSNLLAGRRGEGPIRPGPIDAEVLSTC